MKAPRVTVKTTTPAAGWVLRRAKALGASLVAVAHATANRIYDGYIVHAVRAGDRATVTVLDTPAMLAVPGRLANGNAVATDHCAVIELVGGRGQLLSGFGGSPATSHPSHPGTWSGASTRLGTLPEAAIRELLTNVRTSMCPIPGRGLVHVWVVNRASASLLVNAYSFMGPDDKVVYYLQCFAPTTGTNTYTALPAGGWSSSGPNEFPAPVSIGLVDSIMDGVLPFSRRQSPPAYSATNPAYTAYASAQNVWMRAVSAGITIDEESGETIHTLFVVAQVVCFMASDQDPYGARGLWFARVQLLTSYDALPLPSKVWQTVIDMRDSGDPRTVPLLSGTGTTATHATNDIQPAMMCMLDTGELVTLAVSTCWVKGYDAIDPNKFLPFATVSCYRTNPNSGDTAVFIVAGPTESNLSISLPMKPHDCAFPVGADTDGSEVVAVFLSTDGARQSGGEYTLTPSIDVVRVNALGQSLVLSSNSGARYCFFAKGTSECVKYIGNHKYLFVATSAISEDRPIAKGNLAVFVYDSRYNTVALAGVVDATLRYAESRVVGRMDCPAVETAAASGVVTREATVILTTGSAAQYTGEPGGEDGTTYISYDSGASWVVLADYGSAAGVRYCGTKLSTRKTEL